MSTKRWIERFLNFHIFREIVSNTSSVGVNVGAILIHMGGQPDRFHSTLWHHPCISCRKGECDIWEQAVIINFRPETVIGRWISHDFTGGPGQPLSPPPTGLGFTSDGASGNDLSGPHQLFSVRANSRAPGGMGAMPARQQQSAGENGNESHFWQA